LRFKGKSILITGASGGIGGETAFGFAGQGGSVALNYLTRAENAEKTAASAREIGVEALTVRADVSEPEQVDAMVDTVTREFGGLDVLVNCSALHPPPVFILDEPDWGRWKRMMHVNVMGILSCSHAAAPHLRESGGNIVNVVMDWDAGGVGYTLTKAAGTPLTRGLARELAPIRVNAVSPGAVDTWGMTAEEKRYWVDRTLLKRVGHPKDIADAILFLASEEASYITGATLQVDGGTRLLV
jgi:3-oxoacyl-[acyl-carrier protein] reductase